MNDDLTLNEYQKKALHTAIYPHVGSNLVYSVLALAGEVGELANKVKKLMRSYGLEPGISFEQLRKNIYALPENTRKDREFKKFGIKLIKSLNGELGGILWYVADTAFELHTNLNITGEQNLSELAGRVKNGTQEGEGDRRGRSE